MIPYMVGKLAPNSSHLARGLVKYVPGRGFFRAVPSQNEDECVTSPPPPPIVELVYSAALQRPHKTRCDVIHYKCVMLLATNAWERRGKDK